MTQSVCIMAAATLDVPRPVFHQTRYICTGQYRHIRDECHKIPVRPLTIVSPFFSLSKWNKLTLMSVGYGGQTLGTAWEGHNAFCLLCSFICLIQCFAAPGRFGHPPGNRAEAITRVNNDVTWPGRGAMGGVVNHYVTTPSAVDICLNCP